MKRRQSTPVPKLEVILYRTNKANYKECLMEFNFQRSASEPNGNERKRRKSAGTIDCTKLEQVNNFLLLSFSKRKGRACSTRRQNREQRFDKPFVRRHLYATSLGLYLYPYKQP